MKCGVCGSELIRKEGKVVIYLIGKEYESEYFHCPRCARNYYPHNSVIDIDTDTIYHVDTLTAYPPFCPICKNHKHQLHLNKYDKQFECRIWGKVFKPLSYIL